MTEEPTHAYVGVCSCCGGWASMQLDEGNRQGHIDFCNRAAGDLVKGDNETRREITVARVVLATAQDWEPCFCTGTLPGFNPAAQMRLGIF